MIDPNKYSAVERLSRLALITPLQSIEALPAFAWNNSLNQSVVWHEFGMFCPDPERSVQARTRRRAKSVHMRMRRVYRQVLEKEMILCNNLMLSFN